MTEDANTEALRLIEQTHCESTIDTPLTRDQIEDMYHFTLDEAVRLIALARASQAQPPAGWVMVPREPTVAMIRAMAGFDHDEWYAKPAGERRFREGYAHMLAAAPSPITGEKE